jgi:hypothetical protein
MAFNRWNNDVIPEGLKRKKIPTNSFFFFYKDVRSKFSYQIPIDTILKKVAYIPQIWGYDN